MLELSFPDLVFGMILLDGAVYLLFRVLLSRVKPSLLVPVIVADVLAAAAFLALAWAHLIGLRSDPGVLGAAGSISSLILFTIGLVVVNSFIMLAIIGASRGLALLARRLFGGRGRGPND